MRYLGDTHPDAPGGHVIPAAPRPSRRDVGAALAPRSRRPLRVAGLWWATAPGRLVMVSPEGETLEDVDLDRIRTSADVLRIVLAVASNPERSALDVGALVQALALALSPERWRVLGCSVSMGG